MVPFVCRPDCWARGPMCPKHHKDGVMRNEARRPGLETRYLVI